MKKINLLFVFQILLFSTKLFSQEICNNGIDDDNDGLVDCLDTDCFSSTSCPAFQYGSTCPPASPLGELLAVTSLYRANTVSGATNYTLPAGTQTIKLTILGSRSQNPTATGFQERWNDEDFIKTFVFITLSTQSSAGIQSYICSTNPTGADRTLGTWTNCPLGNNISTALSPASFSGLPATAQNFNFNVTGLNLSITPSSTASFAPDYTILIECFSGQNKSLNLIKVVAEHIAWYEEPISKFHIPSNVDKIFINVKASDFWTNDPFSNGHEEGYASGKLVINRTTNRKTGIFACINGSHDLKRSNYIVNNQIASNQLFLHQIASGDILADNPGTDTTSEASLFDVKIYTFGDTLYIEQGPDYQWEFETVYEIEFYKTVNIPTSPKISFATVSHGNNATTGNWVTRNVTIPAGTQYIEVQQVGLGANLNQDNNENPLESFAFINLQTNKAFGFYNQTVNVGNASVFGFQNLPLDGTTTSGSTLLNSMGVYSEGHTGGSDYDMGFDNITTPGVLKISNRYGLIPNNYQYVALVIFYGTSVDASVPSPSSLSTSLNSNCTYQVSNLYCNQGSTTIPSTFPISYYNGNPFTNSAAVLLGTFNIGTNIPVGQCVNLSDNLNLISFNGTNMTIHAVLGDNGNEVSGGVGTVIGTPLLTNASIQSNANFTDCQMANNTFSFIMTPNCNPLPVELIDFNIEKCDRKACLNWSTESESNSWYYLVRKSNDFINWVVVDTVLAAGNSQSFKEYYLIDEEPFIGDNYYKLEQVDLNGELNFSKFGYLNFEDNSLFKIFPNPIEDLLTIQASDKNDHSIVIYDLEGRVVYKSLFNNLINIDFKNQLSGLYLIVVDDIFYSKSIKK